jgi:DNA-binding transcriptional regulator YhcF (GntR family)
MTLYLDRDSPVPLHDQLCAQLGMQIAAGTRRPGERLPSLRGLAQRLGIHHNTVQAVYRTLAARGVVVLREGSGAYVAELRQGHADATGLAAPLRRAIEEARSRGLTDAAIREAFEAALRPRAPERVVVVNPHPDLLALYLHELRPHVPAPLLGCTLDELAAFGPETLGEAVYLTSANHAAALRAQLGAAARLHVFTLASTDALLAHVATLPPGAWVAVVSGSARIRVLTRELLAGAWPADRIAVADALDPVATRAALGIAGLVVADAVTQDALASHRGKGTRWRLPLLDEAALGALARELGLGV